MISNMCINFSSSALPSSPRSPLLTRSPLLAALSPPCCALPSSPRALLSLLLAVLYPPCHAHHSLSCFSPHSALSAPRSPSRIVAAPFSLHSTLPSSLCSPLLAALSGLFTPRHALSSSPPLLLSPSHAAVWSEHASLLGLCAVLGVWP